jgi:uncharacterized protein
MWGVIFEILFFLTVLLLIFGGLFITVLNLPGVWAIWIGILLTAIVKGLATIPLWFVILSFFFAILVTLIDNFIVPYATKHYGGGKWGMLGGVLGAFVGFLVANLPGLFIGPFVGAFIFEYVVAKRNASDSFKAGFGSFLGIVLSITLKICLCIFMVVAFLTIWGS